MYFFRRFTIAVGLCWVFSLGALLPTGAEANAQGSDCTFLPQPQSLNTFEDADRIVIGLSSERPYVLVVTQDLDARWAAISACVPDAFMSRTGLGRYINVGSFVSRREAAAVAARLSDSIGSRGIQVIHHRRLRR